jgi:hypothetical protein
MPRIQFSARASRVGILKVFWILSDKKVMFADRQVKTSPTLLKSPLLKSPLLKSKLGEIWKWLAAPPVEPPSADSADWYAGLCVDPHSFNDQLCKLQTALTCPPAAQPVAQPVAQDVQPKPVETMAIEFHAEPNA